MAKTRTARQLEHDIYIAMLEATSKVARVQTDDPIDDWLDPRVIEALQHPVSRAVAFAEILTALELELPPPIVQALEDSTYAPVSPRFKS